MTNKRGLFGGLFGRGGKEEKRASAGPGRGVPPTPSPDRSAVPYRIGDRMGGQYEIHQILGGEGRSGMGIVYVVSGLESHTIFALKTFQDRYLASAEVREAFRQEALTWIHLERHPYLVRAYFVENFSGRHYIALQYIPPDEQGRNCLRHYLTGRPLPLEQILRWAIQFCYGTEHALEYGVACHLDIKPDNLMITPHGTLLITDFGLARAAQVGGVEREPVAELDDGRHLGLSVLRLGGRRWCGTPGYIAPEIIGEESDGDARSDIYAFGLVMHQMVSGSSEPPFLPDWRPRSRQDIDRYVQEIYKRQKSESPWLNTPLWPMIERCLKVKPEERYQEFRYLRAELAELLCRQTGEALSPPALEALQASEWLLKGIALGALGRSEEALSCADQALALDPRLVHAWHSKGNALDDLGRSEEALACYDQALTLDPREAQAWLNKGVALDNLGRSEEALSCADQALALDPRLVQAWHSKGVALAKLDRSEEALACYDQALALDPRLVHAWHSKGNALDDLGRSEEALACYDQALTLDPRQAQAWLNKGVVLAKLDRREESLSCYDQALALDPQLAQAWYNKGNALTKLDRREESLSCYDQALALDPREAQAWRSKGNALDDLGRSEEALACYDQALTLDPREAHAWYNKGVVLAKLDRREESLSCADQALALDPQLAQAWVLKGVVLAALGRHAEALSCLKRALALDPRLV